MIPRDLALMQRARAVAVALVILLSPATALAQAQSGGTLASIGAFWERFRLGDVPDRILKATEDAVIGLGLGDTALGHWLLDDAPPAAGAGDDLAFLMDIAGYKIKEIESSVGIIPDISVTFGLARELSESDRAYLERHLEQHARRYPGLIGMFNRTIVRAVADASELGKYEVDKVEVVVLPLPKVKLALAPSAAPLSYEAGRIMRGIDRLNARLIELTERNGAAKPAGE
jgi:hypothetical protein